MNDMNREVLIVFAILALCLIYALAAVPARADAAATAYRVDSEPPAAEPIMTCEEKTKMCYELSEEERCSCVDQLYDVFQPWDVRGRCRAVHRQNGGGTMHS